jgi:hypothetical protein
MTLEIMTIFGLVVMSKDRQNKYLAKLWLQIMKMKKTKLKEQINLLRKINS